MSLGGNLKRLRKDRGLTQAQLGQLTDIKVGHISKLESDSTDPKLSTLYKLLEALDCSADTLLMDKNQLGMGSVLNALFERVKNLPSEKRQSLLEVIEKYCSACEIEMSFTDPSKILVEVDKDYFEPGYGQDDR